MIEHAFEGRGRVSISRQEQASVLALVSAAPGDWSKVAGLLSRAGGVGPVLSGRSDRIPVDDRPLAAELARRLDSDAADRAEALIGDLEERGVRLVTVLDDDYPANLQQVFNRPPFLWVRGALSVEDGRAVSIVGTRQASEWGRATATRFARELAGSRSSRAGGSTCSSGWWRSRTGRGGTRRSRASRWSVIRRTCCRRCPDWPTRPTS
jgi:predicted Rossmann fold nucleotide-binding protein DprA/Smf involved in DNA uptake